MKILEKAKKHHLPFEWLDPNDLPDSGIFRKEIYLTNESAIAENLAILFYLLFGKVRDKLIIDFRGELGDFCLDTWNPITNEYNHELEGKSEETKSYLELLIDSNLELDYSGLCICKNWDNFLPIVLSCIINHKAPFSPLFYSSENEFAFYFHHTGSIGLLYKTENEEIKRILHNAMKSNYLVKKPENL